MVHSDIFLRNIFFFFKDFHNEDVYGQYQNESTTEYTIAYQGIRDTSAKHCFTVRARPEYAVMLVW